MKIAINGFGRIGRNFLRSVLQDPEARKKIEVVAINLGPMAPKAAAHLFKYDTLLGTWPGTVELENNVLLIDGKKIMLSNEFDPACCLWKVNDVAWVVESSGCFAYRDGAAKHLQAGADYVLVTAPMKGEDVTIIPGVNFDAFNSAKDKIVSLGSCTTNALIPILKVLLDHCGLVQGYMTTVHAYTNTQVLLDVEHKDLRRARAAALNIIPTTTGAALAIAKLFPDLEGKVPCMAIRVPVAKVSLVDVSFTADRPMTVESINCAFEAAAKKGSLHGIVAVSHEPLVSSETIMPIAIRLS